MPVYPNRERALRHLKRTQTAYLYGRFPQRYILGIQSPEEYEDIVRDLVNDLADQQGIPRRLLHVSGSAYQVEHDYYQGSHRLPALPGASASPPWSHGQA
ncbi:hypothetical protein E6R18_15730 [Streptomyces sp. A1277]|uniref:hypothetical protein n=1 Tax=Streptomyces sp. A1277 TaxID=2563103 RepID=UPI0010A24946|nr:hypothetical protein [Streptomyces sp. A1277]THA31782.1 hypothetical protein E6R18_15730 [Streptomyces sp. A1277]